MIEIADLDFVKTARAKGIPEHQVARRHVLRNALIPLVTFAGIQAGILVAGSVLVENVFGWPGIGTLAFEAVTARDKPATAGHLHRDGGAGQPVQSRHRHRLLHRRSAGGAGPVSGLARRFFAPAQRRRRIRPVRGHRDGGGVRAAALGPWTVQHRRDAAVAARLARAFAGSDVLGRDMAVGLAYGARVSLLVGIASTLCAACVGIALGALAGYYGGVVDDLLMRITEFFQIIPSFVLLMVLVSFLEPSLWSTVFGIALISWPQVARVVRGEFLSLREREFVQAARVLGQSDAGIIWTQILPNALPPIIVVCSMMVGSAILTESALSFLDLGDPNLLSWGSMIAGSRSAMWVAWWTTVLPGLCIMATVLSLNVMGDGLNAALNPRQGGR